MGYWSDQIKKSAELAKEAHKGQVRWGGESYFNNHVEVVAERCFHAYGSVACVVGYLHDVVEDTSVTLAELRSAGFHEDVIEGVDAMTKRYNAPESYAQYLERLAKNPLAVKVKIVDIKHNRDDLIKTLIREQTKRRKHDPVTAKYKQSRDKYEVALFFLAAIQHINS